MNKIWYLFLAIVLIYLVFSNIGTIFIFLFNAIGTIIVIGILATLGFIGWLFHQGIKKDK